MFSFSEHIRASALSSSDLVTPLLFLCFKREYLGCLFLTFDVPIKVPWISLNITNQVIHVEVMLLPTIRFDFSP